MMPSIGPMELVVVLFVALLILGPKRLPSAGRSLGHGIREFKESIAGRDPLGSEQDVLAEQAKVDSTASAPVEQ